MKFKSNTFSFYLLALAVIINSLGDIYSDRSRHENDMMIVKTSFQNDSTILTGSYQRDSVIVSKLNKLEDRIEFLEENK